ncbi:Uu.00g056620.m01.CDS01 [Anthostomella pinea]|uniref:Uu.00g056620.m01.CDS01 n=1 Tax=Anthostomella pinea TaxID=933095 RepID=A0AAI8VSP2_9PEZI|nr:Uu.00g056620.m01.CDS01 [Anthostomella pinea]
MAQALGNTPEEQWRDMKRKGQRNEPLDKLIKMVGLEEVKTQFLRPKESTELESKHYGLKNERRATFLKSLQVFGDMTGRQWTYKEISGSLLAHQGLDRIKAFIDEITSQGVGVLFIDKIYQLVNGNNTGGASVVDYLLTEMEPPGQARLHLRGYKNDMEKFFAHNVGVRGRIGYEFKFEDYDETQIQQILHSLIEERYKGQMRIEKCQTQPNDPEFLVKAAARRISRGRNQEGFANARAAENFVFQVNARMSQRLIREANAHEAKGAKFPDYFLLTVDDMLGPGASSPLFNSKAWKQLEAMKGLDAVKKYVLGMVKKLHFNRWRELQDLPPLQESQKKVFLGNPGTGKTTVATLYGQILVELGILSNGEVVVKTPADSIGAHIGESEQKTKAILDSTKGKVLVIDEAYQLGNKGGAKGTHGISNSFNTAVIDTLVVNVHSQAGGDRCVLLLGYKDKMEEMFQDANPGLKRRFPLDSAFVFEDFTTEELRDIWRQQVKTRGLVAPGQVEKTAMEYIEKQRNQLNFGNAGEVNIILDAAQKRYQERIRNDPTKFKDDVLLSPADVDPEFARYAQGLDNVKELFKDVIGCEAIKKVLTSWPVRANDARKFEQDIHEIIPMTLAFTGPPGTGKTTIAKKIGIIMHALGLFGSEEVNVISASDLIGEFIGHTGPNVRRQFESSLDQVFFIDEAYRLRKSHGFGQEAIDEIVICLTQEKFKNKLVVVFAGYEQHIDDLLNSNPGMASRVHQTLKFPSPTTEDAIKLLDLHVNKDPFRANCLKNGNGTPKVMTATRQLVNLSTWASGRSVETLAKNIKSATMDEEHMGPLIMIKECPVLAQLDFMRGELLRLMSSSDRAAAEAFRVHSLEAPQAATHAASAKPPNVNMKTTTNAQKESPNSGGGNDPSGDAALAKAASPNILKRDRDSEAEEDEPRTKKAKPAGVIAKPPEKASKPAAAPDPNTSTTRPTKRAKTVVALPPAPAAVPSRTESNQGLSDGGQQGTTSAARVLANKVLAKKERQRLLDEEAQAKALEKKKQEKAKYNALMEVIERQRVYHKAQREADAKAQRDAKKAQREADEKAKREAEKAQQEARMNALKEAIARRDAEKAQRDADEKARRDAALKAERDAALKAHREAIELARQEEQRRNELERQRRLMEEQRQQQEEEGWQKRRRRRKMRQPSGERSRMPWALKVTLGLSRRMARGAALGAPTRGGKGKGNTGISQMATPVDQC